MRKAFRTLCCMTTLLVTATLASAEDPDRSWMPTQSDIESQVGQYLNKRARQGAADTGAKAVEAARSHYDSAAAQRGFELARQGQRKLHEAASTAVEGKRAALMKFLGYKENEPSGLYFLVTWEMPLELLRAYVREARWAGGIVVFKGIPEGKELAAHLMEDYVKLSDRSDPTGTPITIDPRLFDMFDVKAAPAIVLLENALQNGCDSGVPRAVQLDDETEVPYRGCSMLPEDTWWKVSGGVTTLWALDYMASAGSAKAGERARLMRTALTQHKPAMAKAAEDGRTLRPYEGEWEQAITTEDMRRLVAPTPPRSSAP